MPATFNAIGFLLYGDDSATPVGRALLAVDHRYLARTGVGPQLPPDFYIPQIADTWLSRTSLPVPTQLQLCPADWARVEEAIATRPAYGLLPRTSPLAVVLARACGCVDVEWRTVLRVTVGDEPSIRSVLDGEFVTLPEERPHEVEMPSAGLYKPIEGLRPRLPHECADGWVCSLHPERAWPHDDCEGSRLECRECDPDILRWREALALGGRIHHCDAGWVCSRHPDQVDGHDDCVGPPGPCPVCNVGGSGRPNWAALWAAELPDYRAGQDDPGPHEEKKDEL